MSDTKVKPFKYPSKIVRGKTQFPCLHCQTYFFPWMPSSRYCSDCRPVGGTNRTPGIGVVAGTPFECTKCTKEFKARNYKQKLCPDCRPRRGPIDPNFKRGVTTRNCIDCGEVFFPWEYKTVKCKPCRTPAYRVGDRMPCHNCCRIIIKRAGTHKYCDWCRKQWEAYWNAKYMADVNANPYARAARLRTCTRLRKKYAQMRRDNPELAEEFRRKQRERYRKLKASGDVGAIGITKRKREMWRQASGYTPRSKGGKPTRSTSLV